jgi:hypothetical protein
LIRIKKTKKIKDKKTPLETAANAWVNQNMTIAIKNETKPISII